MYRYNTLHLSNLNHTAWDSVITKLLPLKLQAKLFVWEGLKIAKYSNIKRSQSFDMGPRLISHQWRLMEKRPLKSFYPNLFITS